VAGALSLALVAAPAAGAAKPKAGYFGGATKQADGYAGNVDFKVFKAGKSLSLLRISATTQLSCADGTNDEDRFLTFIIAIGNNGKISKKGGFNYKASNGTFSMSGKFTSPTQASGTLSRKVGSCSVSGVSWSAKRGSQAGIPIPTAAVPQTPIPLPIALP
jgi:hypothetical protein